MNEILTARQERHQRQKQTVNAFQSEFIRAWDAGGKKAADALLTAKRRSLPQQSHLIVQAYKNISYIATLHKV